ncbi:MAG: hypothetical protein ACYC0J_05000 [Gammaproteobacteria bacterium]
MEKQKILVVTNAMTDEEVLEIKKSLADNAAGDKITISLVHVIPRLPTCYFTLPSMGMLIERYYDEAKQSLSQVGKHLGVAKKDQWLISGKTRTEVLRLANKLGSSFILASAEQIQELQHSLFIKQISGSAIIKNTTALLNNNL